uniref:Hydrolase n=1 Tax=Thermogemmatispora argillosa TaxID=2045280 RepID=A0A455T600_9CHLR|nr:hydrolase [Thermogemmatispora argillosa]
MQERQDIQKQISAAILQLRLRQPFFATLSLFAQIKVSENVDTAMTDGRSITFNPTFWQQLRPAERQGVLTHEVLHVALQHVPRRGQRDAQLWNIAADIVVNGIIAHLEGLELPKGHVREPDLENLCVEEVYQQLQQNRQRAAQLRVLQDLKQPGQEEEPLAPEEHDRLRDYWWRAIKQARNTNTHPGHLPLGLERELSRIEPSRLDWRSYLWRFLTQTPSDFAGFDRRFIGQRLYLDAQENEQLYAYIAIDTSGSITEHDLSLFLGEVRGILAAYPHVIGQLYYVDSDCHGPYEVSNVTSALPLPQGGGGTNFRPFFERIQAEHEPWQNAVCVYLTDGFGLFPEEPPGLPVLWVVTGYHLEKEAFPFGEVIELVPDEGP